MDLNRTIHHVDDFVYDEIEPKMVFAKSEKSVIAVGTFPGEFWDIYPDLTWLRYDYSAFSEAMKEDSYDMVIVGGCGDDSLKLDVSGTDKPVICYQPSVLSERTTIDYHNGGRFTFNPVQMLETIKTKPVGTPLSVSDDVYRLFTNRFWVLQAYSGDDILEKDGNILYCNGWVLPQYLLKEGLLEV